MSDVINLTQCNVAQMYGEANRFLFHVLLIHISTCIIDGDTNIFSDKLFKTLLITSMAIVLYHLFARKIVEPKVEKMKLICVNNEKRINKRSKLDKKDPLVSEKRIRHKEKVYIKFKGETRQTDKRKNNGPGTYKRWENRSNRDR